jgi:PAS domain S-box-containing protein
VLDVLERLVLRRGLARAGLRYGAAVAAALIAFVLRSALVAWIGGELPTYLIFYPAVMLIAIVAGLGPGLTATAASTLLTWIWIVPPQGRLALDSASDALSLAVFSAMGAFISIVAERYRGQRARSARLQQELLVGEQDARIRLLGDNLPDGALYRYMLDATGLQHFLYVSAGIEKLTGLTAAEILRDASALRGQIFPEDRQRLAEAEARSRESLEAFELELRQRHHQKSGEVRWALVRSVPHREPDGATVWDGVAFDITSRKQAEEGLRRYALLAGRVQDIVLFVRQGDGRIVEANAAATTAYGFTREELLARSIQDLRAPATAGETAAQMAQAEEGALFETEHVRKDGTAFPVEVSSKGDTIAGTRMLISVIRDISDRKRAQAALQEERERLRVILSSIGDAVLAIDAEARVSFINPVAAALTGWTAEDALGKPVQNVLRIIDERGRAHAEDLVARVLRSGEQASVGNLTALVSRGGREIPIEDSASPIRDDRGNVSGVVVVFHEVTDKRQAQQALQESERRVREKLDSILSPQGDLGKLELSSLIDAGAIQALMESFHRITGITVAIVDLQGRVLVGAGWQEICSRFHRANPQTCEHCRESDTQLSTGVPEGEHKLYRCKNNMWDVATPLMVAGRHVGSIFTGQFFFEDEPIDRGVFLAQARQYGFPEEPYLAALERVPRVTRRMLQECMVFLGKLANMISQLTFSNLEIARSLAERDRLTGSLREADAHKNDFLAMLSHELRNPLAPIKNSLFILGRVAPDSAQARRAKETIDRQVGHLTKVVDDLLDVTRISRNKIQLQRRSGDLCEVVRSSIDDQRSIFEARGIHLESDLPEEAVPAEVDSTRIGQAIGNLLQNSAKFTESGGLVRVTLARDPERNQAIIRVSDTGVGLAPSTLAHLFEPFVQADKTLDRSKGGLGLGLALVKGLVEMHGGEVSAYSEGLGKGAEFTLRLPTTLPSSEGRGVPETASPVGHRRVLIIEDNADAAESLRQVLELNGHGVAVAFSGPEGIEKARDYRPQVVLCDIGLPGMDGFAVARALRAEPEVKGAYLVALSGYAQPEDVQRAAEAGFACHLAKPASIDKLNQILASVPLPAGLAELPSVGR